MSFISDIPPTILAVAGFAIVLAAILLFLAMVLHFTRGNVYKNLPVEHINECPVCRKRVDTKKLLFYEGIWNNAGNNGGYETTRESENGTIYTLKTPIEIPATERYYTFEPRKNIFVAVCSSCKRKKWAYELSLELKELFGHPIKIILATIAVVFLLFLLNAFSPQIFFGQFSNSIKAIIIFSFINIAFHVLLCLPSLFTLLFIKDHISGSDGKVRIEADIVENAFEKQGRCIVFSGGSLKRTESIE